jgi:urease accessory protein
MSPPLMCDRVLGNAGDAAHRRRIHDLEHHDAVEVIRLPRGDLARHRLRVVTDKGTECAIALSRSEQLFDGAVLFLDDRRAVVVRAEPERWLVFRAANAAAGLELGYFAGNMHWPVRFEGDHLYVAGESGAQHVCERLHHLLDRGAVAFVGEDK